MDIWHVEQVVAGKMPSEPEVLVAHIVRVIAIEKDLERQESPCDSRANASKRSIQYVISPIIPTGKMGYAIAEDGDASWSGCDVGHRTDMPIEPPMFVRCCSDRDVHRICTMQ